LLKYNPFPPKTTGSLYSIYSLTPLCSKEVTADRQGQTKEDREITPKTRRAIVNDKSLSTNAHNVKIITVDGVVPLKGPVASEDEKGIIEEKAAQIAGNNWLSRNVV
jgi:osmotically-inducible protein OsmY